jgi:hypothetical protein
MAHLWESQATAAVEATLAAVKRAVREDYEAHCEELLSFCDGDHASYMAGDRTVQDQDLVLGDRKEPRCYFQRYLGKNWDYGRGYMLPQYLPFLRRLVEIKATLFHRHPIWDLVDRIGQAAPTEQATRWTRMKREMRATTRLKKLQKRTELLNTAFGRPRWDGRRVVLDVVTPSSIEVYPDPDAPADLDRAFLIRERLPSVQDTPTIYPERWLVWERIPGPTPALDEWNVTVTDNAWRILPNPWFPDNRNPYRSYPYVVFHAEEQQDRLFQPLDDSLLTAQVGLNLLWTWYGQEQPNGLHVFNLNGMKLKAEQIPSGRNFAIQLENPSDTHEWHQIPFEAEGMRVFLEMSLKLYASMHGLTPDVFSLESESFTNALTGLAAQMDRLDVQEVREDREAYWEYKLDDLLDKIRIVHNTHCVSTDRLDEGLRSQIGWAQPAAPVDPQSKAQSRATAIESGTGDPVVYIMEDEHCDEAEAERLYSVRLERLSRLRAVKSGSQDEDQGPGEEGAE